MPIVDSTPGSIEHFRFSPWGLYLANSSDLSIICPLFEASNINLEVTLNRPGRLSFTFPLANEKSVEFIPISRCVLLLFEGEIVWSGPLGPIQDSLPNEQMNIVATGWLELLYHRVHRAKVTYATVTRGFIIHQLLALANSQKTTWISAGTNGDAAPTISKTFEVFENIGQGIEQMTSLEASPDISVDPETRQLNIRNYTGYTDRSSVVWAYGWGPNNLESFSRQVDSDVMANRINVLGKNSNVAGYIAENLASQDTYNLFEESVTLSSVSNSSVLAAYGEAEVLYRGTPRVTYSFQPRGGSDMPCVFLDFQLGDKARLRAVFPPRINIAQDIRIFSASLQIDENGNHRLSNVTTVAS